MDISLDSIKHFTMLQSFPVSRPQRKSWYISQPAEPVGELLEKLGCSLFSDKKGVTLTKPRAKRFISMSPGVRVDSARAERRLEEMLDFETGEVRIGATI